MDWNDDIDDPEEDKLLINKVEEDAVEAVTKVPVTSSEVRSYPCDQALYFGAENMLKYEAWRFL